MSFRKTLLAATMLALPLAAQAQPVTGLYAGGALGVNWMSNNTANPNSTTTTGIITPASSLEVSTGTGFVGLGSLGWGFGNGLRLEAEGNYRSNDVDSARASYSGFPVGSANRAGYITSMGLMANIMYDIGSTMGWPVHLTVGAGAGYAWVRYAGVGTRSYDTGFNSQSINISDTNGTFAWQAIAGLTYPVRAVPGLALTLEYRYFSTSSHNYNGSVVQQTPTGGAIGTGSARFNADYVNNSVLLGVRYNFGRAPAPAPVAAAPAPARSFLVFFDFASDQLTARAREIVSQAAQAARSQQVTRIEVAGHTDTVGSAQYNQGLSIRRANNVAAELVRLGVPRQAITTAGFGFSRPLVPTGPNVREPQNRRVEIVLR